MKTENQVGTASPYGTVLAKKGYSSTSCTF